MTLLRREGRRILSSICSVGCNMVPLGNRGTMIYIVKSSPIIAGMILAAITDGNGALKFSAAMILFGLGEMILPHLPPPIMAINNLALDSLS